MNKYELLEKKENELIFAREILYVTIIVLCLKRDSRSLLAVASVALAACLAKTSSLRLPAAPASVVAQHYRQLTWK